MARAAMGARMKHERTFTAADNPEPEIGTFSGPFRLLIWAGGIVGSWGLVVGIGWLIWSAVS
jgi:hypothetical protein